MDRYGFVYVHGEDGILKTYTFDCKLYRKMMDCITAATSFNFDYPDSFGSLDPKYYKVITNEEILEEVHKLVASNRSHYGFGFMVENTECGNFVPYILCEKLYDNMKHCLTDAIENSFDLAETVSSQVFFFKIMNSDHIIQELFVGSNLGIKSRSMYTHLDIVSDNV